MGSHTASMWQNQKSNPAVIGPESVHLTITHTAQGGSDQAQELSQEVAGWRWEQGDAGGPTPVHTRTCVFTECERMGACPCKCVLCWHERDQARLVGTSVHLETVLRFPQDPSPRFLLFPLHTQEL